MLTLEEAAKQAAGNWKKFDSFAWSRGYRLPDADKWMIWNTSNRDSGLLAQSNQAVIAKRLSRYMRGEDPNVVAEVHNHWAVGYVNCFSIRVYTRRGQITAAFKAVNELREFLEDYPVLDEEDYSCREYEATLENYRHEIRKHIRDELPEGWESEVYSWFSDHGCEKCIENRDDRGGYATEGEIMTALEELGLLPEAVTHA